MSVLDASEYRRAVEEAAARVSRLSPVRPEIGIILGTGLGMLAREIEAQTVIEYDDLPGFPISTVESHHGKLILGTLSDRPVVAMQGRFHLYEGYSARQVTFPVRVMARLGVERLFISNAAGGMNPHFGRGDLMLITDHINLQPDNPLVGPNIDEWGPRFPDMSQPYSSALRQLAEESALSMAVKLHEGVYVAVTGPNLETPAEYRYLRSIGGDAVGMSTVPEVIVAQHEGIDVLAISVITDECFPDALEPISIPEILAAAAEAEPALTAIFRKVASALD